MKLMEEEIAKFINRKFNPTPENNSKNKLIIYYKNNMTSLYKQHEKNLRNIIRNNVSVTSDNDVINLRIYYQSKKLRNLLIKNNNRLNNDISKRSHVVYQYNCNKEECQPSTSYIGYTMCSIVDRMRNHSQQGAIHQHNMGSHNFRINTSEILDNIKIIFHHTKKDNLLIAESLLIKQLQPTLNRQMEGEERILKIF